MSVCNLTDGYDCAECAYYERDIERLTAENQKLLLVADRISDMEGAIERLIIENQSLNIALNRIHHIATQRQADDQKIASHFDTGWHKVMQIADPSLRGK